MSEERGARAFHRAGRLLVCAGFLFGVTNPLLAQKKGAAPAPACVFDTAAHSVSVSRQLVLSVYRLRDTLPDSTLTQAFGAIIQPGFVAPQSIARLFFPTVVPPPGAKVAAGRSFLSDGAFSVRIGRDGVPRDLHWDVLSYDPASEDSIVQPLVRASGSPEMKSIGAMLDSNLVRVLLGDRASDSLTTSSTAVPLLRIHLNALRIDTPVKYVGGAEPQYPIGPRSRGIEGRVRLHFIVGEDGKVLQNSTRVDEFNLPDFAKPSVDAVARAQFEPARVAGCPTPMLVTQVVRFSLGPR